MNKAAFLKADMKLQGKKEELFKQGNVQRWDISPEEIKKIDKSLLLNNREYAYSKMMTKVKIFSSNIFSGKSICTWLEAELWILLKSTCN